MRWDVVRSGLGSQLAPGASPAARWGLMTFPVDTQCGAPSDVRVALPDLASGAPEWAASAEKVRAAVESITRASAGTGESLGGGTPLGPSLRALERYPALQSPARARTLVVLTDGLPNCNPENANDCTRPSVCRCTLANGVCGSSTADQYCRAGCLDESGTVEGLESLRAMGAKAAVIGVGPETNANRDVLDAMALAGGLPRRCSAEAPDCGPGDVCDTGAGLCGVRFHQVFSAEALGAALKAVTATAVADARCYLVLAKPVEVSERLRVLVGETVVERSEWSLIGTTVVLSGQACEGQRSGTAPAAELWYLD